MKLLRLKLQDKYGFNRLFFVFVLCLYGIFASVNIRGATQIASRFWALFVGDIIPVLLLIFVLTFVLNILIAKDLVKKYLTTTKGRIQYLLVIIAGIVSSGPIYARYPLLKSLYTQGLGYGHIATFIYARAIKIPLLSVMVAYFGIAFTLAFNLTVLLLAICMGMAISFIFGFLLPGPKKLSQVGHSDQTII